MLKIGLEKEFWLMVGGKPQIVPSHIPHDECGLLVEARGNPSTNAIDAVYSLTSEIDKIKRRISKMDDSEGKLANNVRRTLSDEPVMKIDRALEIQTQRQYGKGIISWRNLYGIELPSNKRGTMTAAIHISFTNPQSYESGNPPVKYELNRLFDFSYLFRKLDTIFSTEIKNAGRKPGFYEIKHDGRIEYRSLPANVPTNVLIDKLLLAFENFGI